MSHQSVFIGRNISSETKSWLVSENLSFEEHSFIQIVLKEPDFSIFSFIRKKPEQFVVSSQWAAKWLVKYHSRIEFSNLDSVLCLSEKQKLICNKISDSIFVAEQQNAQSLARLVGKTNRGEKVIYLHGNLALNVFDKTLESFKIECEKLEVYRNLPVLKKLENTFDVYLFFSPGGVQNFVNSGNVIPDTSAIVAIGATTAETGNKFFNREIYISKIQEELAAVKFAAGLLRHNEIRNYTN